LSGRKSNSFPEKKAGINCQSKTLRPKGVFANLPKNNQRVKIEQFELT